MDYFLKDKAISTPEEDGFGRKKFAGSIANALAEPLDTDSIVFAIEGVWGSGKSSVLNMIEFYLNSHESSPLVIKIDSWLLSGSDNILETFLIQLASQFGSLKPDDVSGIAKKTLEFAKLLSPLKLMPGIEPWASGVETILNAISTSTNSMAELSKFDLRKRKDQVSESIKFYDNQIVVIIDDIDRLEPNEIRQVFQLVKAVADFDRVSYLLSYDTGPVHNALSYSGNYDGAEFLEKIVQVSYTLPKLSYRTLKRFFSENILKLAEKYNLTDQEKERLEFAISKGGLSRVLRHPRDVIRVINRLRVSIPLTRGEVNFSDVVAYELLSIRFPKVAKTLQRNPYEFVGGMMRHPDPTGVDIDDSLNSIDSKGNSSNTWKNELPIPTWKNELWETLDKDEKRSLFILVDFIFPDFRSNKKVKFGREVLKESDLCIRYKNPLFKLLSLGLDEDEYSAIEAKEFLGRSECRNSILTELYQADILENWFSYLINFLNVSTINDPKLLCKDIIIFIEQTEFLDKFLYQEIIKNIGIFFTEFVKRQSSLNQKKELFLYLSDSSCLEIADSVLSRGKEFSELFAHYSVKTGDSREMASNNCEILEIGRNNWLRNIRKQSEDIESFSSNLCLLQILFSWGVFQGEEFGEVQEFIKKLISTEGGVIIFQDMFEGYSFKGLEKLIGKLELLSVALENYPEKSLINEDLFAFLKYFIEKEKT